jgi:hypothetical protein
MALADKQRQKIRWYQPVAFEPVFLLSVQAAASVPP